jgi:hypothetical protein
MPPTQLNAWVLEAFKVAEAEFNSQFKEGEKVDFSQYRSIQEVYDVTDDIQRTQSSSGTLRNLSRIKPYLDGLSQYAGVIEVFVQAKPDLLALIWVCNTDP